MASASPSCMATVRRDSTRLSGITYDGAPRFQPIEGTSLSYAVNAGTPVIQVNPNTYFAVENGVWFVGGDQVKLIAALRGTKTEAAMHAPSTVGSSMSVATVGAVASACFTLAGENKIEVL